MYSGNRLWEEQYRWRRTYVDDISITTTLLEFRRKSHIVIWVRCGFLVSCVVKTSIRFDTWHSFGYRWHRGGHCEQGPLLQWTSISPLNSHLWHHFLEDGHQALKDSIILPFGSRRRKEVMPGLGLGDLFHKIRSNFEALWEIGNIYLNEFV